MSESPSSASSASTYSILFVDDDVQLLEGLRAKLHRELRGWKLAFKSSAEQALEHLKENDVDVVVSDMRMPGMDGARFLKRVQNQYPGTVRFMLSGQASEEELSRALSVTHQVFTKPCDAAFLVRALRRVLTRIGPLPEDERRGIVGAPLLRCVPSLGTKVMKLLSDPEATLDTISDAVSLDPGLTAKVLQLANSQFVGAGAAVRDLRTAVQVIGIANVCVVAVSAESSSRSLRSSKRDLEYFETLAMRATLTASVLKLTALDQDLRIAAVEAARLQYVGVLFRTGDELLRFIDCLNEADASPESLEALERERFGTTHAEMCAALLTMWGIPDCLVDTVAHTLDPESGMENEATLAVLDASAIVDRVLAERMGDVVARNPSPRGKLDGLTERAESWRPLAEAAVTQLLAKSQRSAA